MDDKSNISIKHIRFSINVKEYISDYCKTYSVTNSPDPRIYEQNGIFIYFDNYPELPHIEIKDNDWKPVYTA